MESSTHTTSDFSFKTIGQQPSLFRRFSSTGPSSSQASPSPSPPRDSPPADTTHALKSRPSLFALLSGSTSLADPPARTNPDPLFIPSPTTSFTFNIPRADQPRLQFPPTPPEDAPPSSTMPVDPPLATLSALKERLSTLAASLHPPDLAPVIATAHSSREHLRRAHELARRAVSLSADSLRAAQAASAAAQESLTAADTATSISDQLLNLLNSSSSELDALALSGPLEDLAANLAEWTKQEETSRSARVAAAPRMSSAHQDAGRPGHDAAPGIKVDPGVPTPHFSNPDFAGPATPSPISAETDTISDAPRDLRRTIIESRIAEEAAEQRRRQSEDEELKKLKEHLADVSRSTAEYEKQLQRVRSSREEEARREREVKQRLLLEDHRKQKAKKVDEEREAARIREGALAERRAADERRREAEEQETRQRAAALELDQAADERKRELERVADARKHEQEIADHNAQAKANKEEWEAKRQEVQARKKQALLQNAQEAQARQTPLPSPTSFSGRSISGGIMLGTSPSDELSLDAARSASLGLRAVNPAKLPVAPSSQQSRGNTTYDVRTSVPPISHLEEPHSSRGSSLSVEYTLYSTTQDAGNIPLVNVDHVLHPVNPEAHLPLKSPVKKAPRRDHIVPKSEQEDISIPVPMALRTPPRTSVQPPSNSYHQQPPQVPPPLPRTTNAHPRSSIAASAVPGSQNSASTGQQLSKKQQKAARRAQMQTQGTANPQQHKGKPPQNTQKTPTSPSQLLRVGAGPMHHSFVPTPTPHLPTYQSPPRPPVVPVAHSDGGWDSFNKQNLPDTASLSTDYPLRSPPAFTPRRADHYSPPPQWANNQFGGSPLAGSKRPRDDVDDATRDTRPARRPSPTLLTRMKQMDTDSDDFAPVDFGNEGAALWDDHSPSPPPHTFDDSEDRQFYAKEDIQGNPALLDRLKTQKHPHPNQASRGGRGRGNGQGNNARGHNSRGSNARGNHGRGNHGRGNNGQGRGSRGAPLGLLSRIDSSGSRGRGGG